MAPQIKIPISGHLYIEDKVYSCDITLPHPDWLKIEIPLLASGQPAPGPQSPGMIRSQDTPSSVVLSFTSSPKPAPPAVLRCACLGVFHGRVCPMHPARGVPGTEPTMPKGPGIVVAENYRCLVNVDDTFTVIKVLAGGGQGEDIILTRL